MLTLSHVHQLFSVETCQTYIHTLRWKDRPLQCPRCQSQDVDPWGQYQGLHKDSRKNGHGLSACCHGVVFGL